MRRPVPPRPLFLGDCENEQAVERAAGVAVFSGVIQVLVRARKWIVCREALAEMVSAFLTSDWQFHSPPSTSSCRQTPQVFVCQSSFSWPDAVVTSQINLKQAQLSFTTIYPKSIETRLTITANLPHRMPNTRSAIPCYSSALISQLVFPGQVSTGCYMEDSSLMQRQSIIESVQLLTV